MRFHYLGLAAALFSAVSFADVSAFKLTLGKTTVDEAKATYSLNPVGYNLYSNGPMFEVSPQEVGFDGLKKFIAIFSPSGELDVIVATLPKHQFDSIHQMLAQRYSVTSAQLPFVGNKLVKYAQDDIGISLESPHMSFDMTLAYATNTFQQQYDEGLARKQQAEQAAKAEALGAL